MPTGCAGSAAAHHIARRSATEPGAAQHLPTAGLQEQEHPSGSLAHVPPVVLRSGCERGSFMAVSANARHALLYAAEDRLAADVAGPLLLGAVRALLHVANSTVTAWRWRTVADRVYPREKPVS